MKESYVEYSGIVSHEVFSDGINYRVISDGEGGNGRNLISFEIEPCVPFLDVVRHRMIAGMEYLDTTKLSSLLGNEIVAKVLVRHIIKVYSKQLEKAPVTDKQKRKQLIAAIYNDLVKWGDSSPARSISEIFREDSSVAYNLLRSVRRAGYLPHVGMGVRTHRV